jgi:hypothetical protein
MAAAGFTAPDDAQAATTAAPGRSLTEAVLAAFQAQRVVAIGDAHASQEVHDLVTSASQPGPAPACPLPQAGPACSGAHDT